jgi:hypothetical protein
MSIFGTDKTRPPDLFLARYRAARNLAPTQSSVRHFTQDRDRDCDAGSIAGYVTQSDARIEREFLCQAHQRNKLDPVPATLLDSRRYSQLITVRAMHARFVVRIEPALHRLPRNCFLRWLDVAKRKQQRKIVNNLESPAQNEWQGRKWHR